MHTGEPLEGRTATAAAADCAGGLLQEELSLLRSSAGLRALFAMVWIIVPTQLERSPVHIDCPRSNFSVMQLHDYPSPADVARRCRHSSCLQPDTRCVPAALLQLGGPFSSACAAK